MPKEKLSRSKDLAARVVYAALQVLKEKGGQAPRKELIEEVPNRVQLDDWARTLPLLPIYFYAPSNRRVRSAFNAHFAANRPI